MSGFLSNKRNVIILVIVVLLLLGLGVALLFFGQEEEGPIELPTRPIVANLTWWKPFYGREVFADIIADFRALPGNSQINIEIINKNYGDGSDYYTDIIRDIARDAGPDLYTIRNDDLPAMQEFMSPISLFQGATLTQYQQDFVDLAVRDTTVRDEVYAITSYVENMQLYYNTDILAQSGIALPPSTWADLDRQISVLSKRDSTGFDFNQNAISLGTGGRANEGGPNINRFQDIIPLLIFQSGGQIFDYQTNQVALGEVNQQDLDTGIVTGDSFSGTSNVTDPVLNALDFYTDFADTRDARFSWNTSSPNNIDQFVAGRLAYMIHYKYMDDIISSRNSRLRYDVAKLPQLDPDNKKTFGFFFMDGMSVELARRPENADKLAAAERFLYYLSLPETQNKLAVKTQLPGARKDVIQAQQQSDNTTAIFAEGALFADNYYKPDVIAVEQIWADLIERVQYEGVPLDESLQEASNEYRNFVSRGPVPR